VAERIEDIRRLGISRRDALQRLTEREVKKPVQVVSPEKVGISSGSSGGGGRKASSSTSPNKVSEASEA
ncbi:hypothetical protein AAVH_36635, partial [Aphelenchoides avenae]